MLGAPAFASSIDRERIGLFGFSRGGYTALAVIGANPDWASVTERCKQFKTHVCDQVRAREFPGSVTHDPRIKAAVIADPLSVFFTDNSFGDVRIPVQLWASEFGGDGVLPHSVDIVDRTCHKTRISRRSELRTLRVPGALCAGAGSGIASHLHDAGGSTARPSTGIQRRCARVLSGTAGERTAVSRAELISRSRKFDPISAFFFTGS